jgi:asparagine synthase (glutamine-hydrolysing)
MCGIAGIFQYADPDCPVDRDLLARMTRRLAHRGPDAESFFVDRGIGFGHRRLSIVDLTSTGAQPMSNDDGSCWITYNGEFYNHAEFRPALAGRGARFRGSSDTETLLRLMEIEGPDRLADAAGIFAFGFWDRRTRTLTLARDPLGVKQLYFHDNGRRIVFASEMKALLEDPEVPRDPDPEAINQYLHFHTALFDRTFFRGIRQLRAGEYSQINRHGARLATYWRVDDFTKIAAPDNDVIDDLRHRLSGIVGDQLMSDVPVGSFFSGGIDSSAVAAFASQAGRKPVCFGVHFSGQGVTDERPYQEAAAKALDLDLRLITMDGSTFPDDFRRLLYHQDEPVIGAAMFPMSRVSELASRSVKVCLGGQAADEIFGGYARYALGRPMQVIRSWFFDRHQGAGHSNTEASVGGNLARQFAEGGTLYRLARNARHLTHWETSYFEHFAKVPERAWLEVFSGPEFCSRSRSRQLFHDVVRRSPATEPMDKIMHWDLQTYLTGLFHQDDRMSMASSLESRVP